MSRSKASAKALMDTDEKLPNTTADLEVNVPGRKPELPGYSTLLGGTYSNVVIKEISKGSSEDPQWRLVFEGGDPLDGRLVDAVLNIATLKTAQKDAKRTRRQQKRHNRDAVNRAEGYTKEEKPEKLRQIDQGFTHRYATEKMSEAYLESVELGNRPPHKDLALLPEWAQQSIHQRQPLNMSGQSIDTEPGVDRMSSATNEPVAGKSGLQLLHVISDLSTTKQPVTAPASQRLTRRATAERADVAKKTAEQQRAKEEQQRIAAALQGAHIGENDVHIGEQDAMYDTSASESAAGEPSPYVSPSSEQKMTSFQVFQKKKQAQRETGLHQQSQAEKQGSAPVTPQGSVSANLQSSYTSEHDAVEDAPVSETGSSEFGVFSSPSSEQRKTSFQVFKKPAQQQHQAAQQHQAQQQQQRRRPNTQPPPHDLLQSRSFKATTASMPAATVNHPTLNPAAYIMYGSTGQPPTQRPEKPVPPQAQFTAAQETAIQEMLTEFCASVLWHRYCTSPPARDAAPEFKALTSNSYDNRGVMSPTHPVPDSYLERALRELNRLFEVCRPDRRLLILQVIRMPGFKDQNVHALLADEVLWVRRVPGGPWSKKYSEGEIGLLLECVGIKPKGSIWKGCCSVVGTSNCWR